MKDEANRCGERDSESVEKDKYYISDNSFADNSFVGNKNDKKFRLFLNNL